MLAYTVRSCVGAVRGQVVGNRPAYEPDTFRTYDSAYPPEAHMKFSVHGDKGKEIACRVTGVSGVFLRPARPARRPARSGIVRRRHCAHTRCRSDD